MFCSQTWIYTNPEGLNFTYQGDRNGGVGASQFANGLVVLKLHRNGNATRSGETGMAAVLIPGSGRQGLDVDGSDVVSAQADTIAAELDLEGTT